MSPTPLPILSSLQGSSLSGANEGPGNSLSNLGDLLLTFGQLYLSSGGPVSRLEQQIEKIAQRFGCMAQIFAIPSFLFLNLQESPSQIPTSFMRSIPEQSLNLARLKRLERAADRILGEKSNIKRAWRLLNYERTQGRRYPPSILIISSFLIGFFVVFPIRLSWISALISGFLCLLLEWSSPLFEKRYQLQGFFLDFFASFVALFVSGLLASKLGTPSHETSLGVLVTLVPGLSLTVAISEITGGHVVSGLIRLTRAFLTLLSMGLAWVLVREGEAIFPQLLQPATKLAESTLGSNIYGNILNLFSSIVLVLCFGVFFQVPRKHLKHLIPIATVAFVVYESFLKSGSVLPSFCAAFIIGTLSNLLARYLRVPSQIFSTPCVLLLVPGLIAFSGFQSLDGSNIATSHPILRALMTAIAIVFGLILSRLLTAKQSSKDTAL